MGEILIDKKMFLENMRCGSQGLQGDFFLEGRLETSEYREG